MNTFRKLITWVLAAVMAVVLAGLTWAIIINSTIGNRTTIKNWLASSGTYDHIVGALLENANATSPKGNDIDPSDPKIVAIANQAYSSSFLQNSTETVLDSTYSWLEGKTTKPEFAIDLSTVRQTFITGLSSYAKERTTSLPECAAIATPNDYDAFTATCRPKNVTTSTIDQQVNESLSKDTDFLSNTTFSADSITTTENGKKVPVYTKLASLPEAYQFGKSAPVVLVILFVALGTALIFIHPSKLKGIRKIGSVLITAASGLVVTLLVTWLITRALTTKLSGTETTASVRAFAPKLVHEIGHSFIMVLLELLLAFALSGALLWTLVFITKRRHKNDRLAPETQPGYTMPSPEQLHNSPTTETSVKKPSPNPEKTNNTPRA